MQIKTSHWELTWKANPLDRDCIPSELHPSGIHYQHFCQIACFGIFAHLIAFQRATPGVDLNLRFPQTLIIFINMNQNSNRFKLAVVLAVASLLLVLPVSAIQPTLLLPVESTKGVRTEYSIGFVPEQTVPHSAKVRVIFPFEFDPRALISYSSCKLQRATGALSPVPCAISNRTFTLEVGAIAVQAMTVVIGNILNPTDGEMSSQFIVQTLFKQVIVQSNQDFGKTPFTATPINGGNTMSVSNYENTLVDMGSSWVFQFTLSQTYPVNTTIRFVFPEGFSTLKIQCNITGVSDIAQQTRVFPNGRVYDCLNVKSSIIASQRIIVSGVINPNYELSVSTIEAHVLQPNSIVVLEKVAMNPVSPVTILHKTMNATITIPNKFRNNTLSYIFQLNMDSDLYTGDYMLLRFTGNWTFFLADSAFIEGINSDAQHTPVFLPTYNWPTQSNIYIRNFSSILRSSQIAFYVSLRTPLTANTYSLTISAYREKGGLVEQYTTPLIINDTTGYIREMKLHPMIQAIKLPVGKTGPLQFTLGLRNNLPQTNVLTYGKLDIKITPNLPLPNVNTNGVPKCYFYGNIEAKNCSYNATDPSFTRVIAFTPIDFNFQSSEIPFMITTEGYIDPQYEGLTIDTLVKRYHFHVQFYTEYSPEPIPTEVIFGDWVADSIPLTTFSCLTTASLARQWDHLVCTFTTPLQDLCQAGYFHFFRIEFTGSNPGAYGWHNQLGYSTNHVYPDYPCISYGVNLTAVPYMKCDLVTWASGPYASEITKSYVNIYGFELMPGGSTITVEIPHIKRHDITWDTQLRFTILQDTWGYQTDYITLYSQVVSVTGTSSMSSYYDTYFGESVSYTLSNSVINKVTSITLNNYNLGQSNVTHIIFEVDQTLFADIGRGHHITCGTHVCSKFNKPIQYFILYPSRVLAQYETLTFPSIATPVYAGSFQFRIRVYANNAYVKYASFNIVIDPETLNAPTYSYSSLESLSVIYPRTDHYYTISFVTKNPLPATTSYISIILDNHFTLSQRYCVVTTTAPANDTRGIECEVWKGENKVLIQNLGAVPSGTSFSVSLQMRTTSTSSTIAPTVSIITYYSGSNIVDRVLNAAFATPNMPVTNLQTLTTFSVPDPQTIERHPTKGYFGHLLLKIRPVVSNSVTLGYYLVLTFTNEFYPYSNQAGLPLSCKINGVRLPCSYTLAPFTVTISSITGRLSTSTDATVNITTDYLDLNGIYYPANQGRYLIQAQILNNTGTQTYELVQQYIDILPGPVSYFNVTYGHRDTGKENIFEVAFRTGSVAIPAYNDATTAGRIYIGFPTKDDANADVFTTNLGFSTGIGTVIPCWFQTGVGYISAVSGTNLTCKLRTSPYTPKLAYVQVINFNQLPANTNVKIVMAKIVNPVNQKYDINFVLRVNSIAVATKEESTLYESYYNMFFNMLTPSVTNRNELDSTTVMFGPGSKVGDYGKFINVNPYTGGTFSTGDWYIVEMNSEFPLNGQLAGCLPIFYQNCIVFREINWFAIKIGNTTILPLQVYVLRLPTSISRVDTIYKAYTFLASRYSEVITYTITANYRWMELRGSITGFSLQVLGSQDKLNIGQKNVDVLVSFTTSHITYKGGSIEIKFPSNSSTVPLIRPHCRSVVTLGSQLQGFPTGKPVSNVEGDVGCVVQNTYSWIITAFDELPANSQVSIVGSIDLPNIQTATLGMGYVVTYINTDPTNVFTTCRIIDYLSTNFPLQVNNKTWNLDHRPTMIKSEPLRVNHVGELKFKLKFASSLYGMDNGGGYVDISLWTVSIFGIAGGFNGPTSNLVCKIVGIALNERFGCKVISATNVGNYYTYRMQSIQVLNSGVDYEYTLTTQNGNAAEGINFPSVQGVYKVETIIKYSSGNSQQVSKPYYIEVYGADFRVLNFISTISIPSEYNMILVEFIPPQNIGTTNEQVVIEIPTSSVEGTALFPEDLGMGYKDYDNLVFDLYESSITSMKCKVYTGDKLNNQPVKIVCSSFSSTPGTSTTIKMGFWVKNPSTSVGLAIPVQVYSFEPNTAKKNAWSLVEAAIKVLPTTTTAIADLGNFAVSSTYRQISGVHFDFTTRNTKIMVQNDLYILKFNFDLRMSQKYPGSFKYNTGLGGVGDVIFMQNCQTVILRVGATNLALMSTGSTSINARIESLFYNPYLQLSTSEAKITGYAVYLATEQGEVVNHNDAFPTLVPREMTSPSFSINAVHGNLNKGSREDYTFTFTYSTSSSGTDMALVKMISIQFPPYSTYDFTFANTQCMEHPSSTIEVERCWIDTTTYTIWVVPVVKASYINSNNFMVETRGLSIRNPINNSTINLNQFVIRYYTWIGSDTPVLYANSDNFVFFKQDSTYIGSSLTTFVTSYIDRHTDVKLLPQHFVNEFEPGSADIGTNRMKTPFQFIVKAMAVFSTLSSNYHEVRLTFNSYYTYSATYVQTNDLFTIVPTCHLNGVRLHYCTISGGKIITRFQQGFALGQEMAFRFSVLNQQNNQDDGFYMTNLNNPTITLPLEFYPYGGSNYYAEAEPFHSFHRISGTYPQLGIYSASVVFGHQVYAKLNYLEFSLSFSRTDINGLVLEIPVVSADGVVIYNDPTLVNLPSGSEYPCSVGIGSSVYCYYEKGSNSNFGRPTRIYITQFGSVSSLSLRMLFTNPDIVGVFPKFNFVAFGGSFSAPNLMGNELMGRFSIIDPFKTYPDAGYYSSGSSYWAYPNRNLYSKQTVYDFYITQAQNTNSYVVAEWILTDATYGDISEYEVVNSYINDYFVVCYSVTDRRLYMVKKLGGYYNGGSSDYHRFGYIKQKHFLLNSYNVYLMKQPSLALVTVGVDISWVTTYRMNNYYNQPSIQYLDVENKITGTTSWHYLSVSLGTTYSQTAYIFDSTTDQHSAMVLAIKFVANRPFTSFASTTQCHIESGVSNYNKLVPVTCELDTTYQQIIIRNIGVITAEFVKVYYYANLISSDQGSTQVEVRLYANSQAYASSGGWAIYSGTTPGYNLVDMFYTSGTYASSSAPNTGGSTSRFFGSGWADTAGYSRIIGLSTTQIVVRLYRGNAASFPNVFQMIFRFYVERLSFSGCQSVSYWNSDDGYNSRSLSGCGTSGKHFWATYSYYVNGNFDWPYWNAGEYYDFTFTFNSISGDVSNDAAQLFVSTTINWQKSVWHVEDNAKCGCYQPGDSCCCWYTCYPCHWYYSCRWYYDWGTFLLTGGNVQAWVPGRSLASSYGVDLISRQRAVQTELSITVNSMQTNVGPSYGSFLLFHLGDGQSYTNSNPFPDTRSSDVGAYIDCKCVVGSSISISSGTTYQHPQCVRYIMSGYEPSFSVYIDVPQGQSLMCFFPGHFTSTPYYPNYIRLHMYLNFANYFTRYFPQQYWSAWANNGAYQYYVDTGLSGNLNTVSDNNYWSSSGAVLTYRYYDLNITSPYWIGNPIAYMSNNVVQPTSGMCSSGFLFCRAYTSYINRRYYIVAKRSGSSYTIRFSDNTYFPPSMDASSSYYEWFIAYAHPTEMRYYHTWTSSYSSTGILYPSTPSYGINPTLYGTTLSGYPSGYIFSIDLNGKTLYSNKRNYGEYQGSFMRLTLAGYTSLFGCAATLTNRLASLSAPFYCEVKSSNTLEIRTRVDLNITGTLEIVMVTTSVPNSVTYTFELFDKYVSSSDYARTVAISNSFGRVASGFNVVQPTSILWRRQVYKQFQSTSAPIRFIFNNNYQYVYDYVTPGNSDAIAIVYPGGLSSSYSYSCFLKEYPFLSRHLYRSYEANCDWYTTDVIRITSIPSHILSPDYYYEIAIYRNNNGASMGLTLNTNAYFWATIQSLNTLNSYTVINQDFLLAKKYQSVFPITLNSIYTLTTQASATNSLYISFTLNTAGVAFQTLEFEFDNLGLSSFQISNGDIIPCYLSAQFSTISGKTLAPRCRGYAAGLNEDSPLLIRVEKFASMPSGTNWKVAFDEFSNPAVQTLYMYPINVRISFNDRTNNKKYTSYFPSLYASDSVGRGIPSAISGSLSFTNGYRGASSTHYISTSWPYSSTYSDISQKVVLKVRGGVTCCTPFSNLGLTDNRTGGSAYTLLWTDKVANISVYRTPSITGGWSTDFQVTGIVNPYPYQKETYQQIKKIEIDFYSSYKNVYIKQIDQRPYTDFTQLSQISVATDFGSPTESIPSSYSYHVNYPMTYDIGYTFSLGSFSGRKLDYTLLKFTSGVQSIEKAYIRYSNSPYVVNSVLDVKILKDSSNYWCLKVTGMNDNVYSGTWYIRMRFYPNGNNLNYISTTYAQNGEIQFSNSDSEPISSDGYSTSPIAPTTFELFEMSYTYSYFQMQRKWLYAAAGLTSKRLQFKFTPPYSMSEVENFNINLPSSTVLIPQNSPGSLTCVIQPTVSSQTILGVGLSSSCSYSVGVYTVKVPIGGLQLGQEYTLSIMERNQTTTTFTLPTSPVRYEVSFVYNSNLALKFGDTYTLSYSSLVTGFSVSHLILKQGTSNFIGFTFTPQFTLPASSLAAPITESVLEIEFENRYFADCLGIDNLYSGDGMTFQNGVYFTHYSSPAVTNANTRIFCGQYSSSYTTPRLRVTDYGQFTAGTSYYFRFPMITNPGTYNIPLIYKIRLLSYANSNYYPTVMGSYEYNGLQSTVVGNTYQTVALWTTLSNAFVQSSMGLSVTYSTYRPPNGAQIAYKFKNSDLGALQSLATLPSISNSDYAYEYYPNINLCMFKRNTGTVVSGFSLGNFPTTSAVSTFSTAFVYAYHDSSTIYYSDFSSNINKQDSISYATSWTSSSITKVSGLTNSNSMGIYTITFRSAGLTFPEGSYMTLTLDTHLLMFDEYCKQMSGFVQGTTLDTSNLICRKNGNYDVLIAGYNSISSGTTLSVTLYLQVVGVSLTTYNPSVRIIVYSSTGAKIIDATTSTFTLSVSQYGPQTLSIMDYMEQTLKKDTAQELDFSFTLTSNTLGNGDYVQVDFGNWTIDPASIEGRTIWKYKVGANIYWVPTTVTLVSGNVYKIPVYQNYSMTAGQLISVKVFQELPDAYQGVYFTQQQFNYLIIKAYNSAGTVLQHQYVRLWIEPYQHTSLQVTPILTYTGATTLYQFSFTPNVSAAAGNVISVEFTTNDEYQTSLFSETLGRTMYTNNSLLMSCHETNHAGIISPASTPISCELFKGNAGASPSVPTTVQIPIVNAIAANTQIKFNIMNILNPGVSGYPIGITVKLMGICDNTDQNNLCTFYRSTKYITFSTLSTAIPTLNSPYGTLSFNPNRVSAINTLHTFTGSYTVNTGDYLKIVYYPQIPIPKVCAISSSNGVCYSYPAENTIVIVATTTQTGSYSFTMSGMTNLYQSRVSQLPSIEIWNAATGRISGRHEPSYWTNHITIDPVSGLQPTITFIPTLTPDYQLKYGFNNIARIEMTYLLQNDKINMIYLTAPAEITIATSYCNATMESTTAEAAPYPYRFQCYQVTANSLMLYKQDNFPAWNSAFINKKIIVYLKYQIADWKNIASNNWNVATYTTTSGPDTWYRVSEGWGNFNIIEYLSPYIYKINFPTQAFSKRTCRTSQLCMFYGYLLPSTTISAIPLSYMTYTLPPQFGYSNLTSYSGCKMEEKNDDFNPTTCSATRTDSDVTMKFYPSSYNHKYKLITIDTSDQTKLFKAPAYPGTHYQMKVNLFTSANILVESMMVNLTTVYGNLLNYVYMSARIPKDADQLGLFQFKFRVGATDILPGYENSATNRITSKIEFQFSKSFASDLGTGRNSGDEVACLPISGLALITTGKLTCKIYPSYSTITYPRIEVSGYDRVSANTDVVIRIAGLKTLPLGQQDYIKMGVSLTYYDYGRVKGYVYEPTGIVVGNTTAPSNPAPLTVSLSESSSNFVGDLVNYTFSVSGAFSAVSTSDYVAIQFEQNVFEGVFSLNQKALCSLASGSQCLSFGLSKIIYFRPSSTLSPSTLNFNLNNIINSAYSFEYVNTTFKVFTLINDKVNAVGTASITKFSKPSTNVSAIVTKIDSLYGGDSGINYYFQLKLNSNLPKYGLISIQFPEVYDTLFNLNSTCVLSSSFPWGSTCEIVGPYLLVIRPNGNLLNPNLAYQFTVTNITNPNMKLTTYSFIITTQFNDNIYNRLVISRSRFACPEISVLTVKTCTTFEVIIGAHNAFFETVYDVSLICPSYIKEASELKLYLSWNPDPKTDLCSSATDSLYSYQCAVSQEYQSTTKFTYLSMYLKGITPQKLISLRGKVKNGMIGTYSLVANISYKGFTYLSTTSNSFFINSDTVQGLSNTQMTLKNYPINRAENAIYTIKMPRPASTSVTSSITDINIEVPQQISMTETSFACRVLSQTFSEDYISLLLSRDQNQLTCTSANNIIKISNIGRIISGLGSDDFLRLSFYRLKNANTSTTSRIFKVSFLDSSTGSGTVLTSGPVSFPLSVSSPPSNLQINKILTASSKLLVRNLYTFNLTTVAGDQISINSLSQIGFIINFPKEYRLIWNRIQTMPSITLVFTDSTNSSMTYTTTAIGVNGTLVANFTVSAGFKFRQVITSFTFINPSETIDCTGTQVFNIAILDLKKNSFVAETLGNNIECPQFDDRLYQVNISGNSYMEAGSVYEYTISIQRPAEYLRITPSIQTSAVSFEPANIVFSGYNQTIKKFKVKISTGLTGTFLLSFTKVEGAQTFYNDIPSMNITTKATTRNYSVTFSNVDVKSIGLPIQIEATLEVENSKQFTLVYSQNCSAFFTFSPTSFKNLAPGTKSTSIAVTYSGTTIPRMCVIDFSISSVTVNNYVLTTPRLYISASRSIDRSSVTAAMRLQISPAFKESSDVGSTVLSKQTETIKPVLYNLTQLTVGANSAKFLSSCSEPGTVYFAVMKIGTNEGKVLQANIYANEVDTGISYGSAKTWLSGTISTIQGNLTATGLSAQTRYLIGAYVNSSVGISDIKFTSFQTKKSSNGAAITIAFTSIETNANVIDSVSKTLRVAGGRVNVMTVRQVLSSQQSTFDNSVMNIRHYVYEIVLGPNPQDDSVNSIDVLNQFKNSDDQIKKMKTFLPSFVATYSMSTRQIITAIPRFRTSQEVMVLSATYETVKIAVNLWEQAFVYAVIVPVPTENLLAAQVIGGFDQDNNPVSTQHFKSSITDSQGYVELEFSLLESNKEYKVYVAAESVVPYQPREKTADADVKFVSVKTGENLNLKDSEETVVARIKEINPELATAVEQHIKDTSNKKKTSPSTQSGYQNNKWWEKEGKVRVVKKIKL